jgi:O-antigen/teichoic acid export membrane protein
VESVGLARPLNGQPAVGKPLPSFGASSGLMGPEGRPARPRTASIIISCYNYGRYVAAAIESALAQTHPVQVIVVDDGSTDDSPAVIARYADRVQVVTKANGGQGSVFNLGCGLATGDAVFLLDADDELRPEAVETILGLWRTDAVLVQWRPSLMNVEGDDIQGNVPPDWVPLGEGDVREELLATGVFAVTVTSGLAARRDVLLRILPMPEAEFRLGADGFLVRALAFEGLVQAVDRPLTRYRLHGANMIGGSPARIAATCRKYIGWARAEFDAVKSLARRHGLTVAEDVGSSNVDYLRYRLYSLVTEPESHPLPGERRGRLLRGIIGAQSRTRMPPLRRLLTLALDLLVGILPRKLAWRPLSWWYGLKEISRLSATAASRPGWLARVMVSESLRDMTGAPETVSSGLLQDTTVALRNAAKLAVSLVGTWTVGVAIRFWMPRHLGPDAFGLLTFAEGLAASVLGCASLGIDTYVQKEIPLRPRMASDFYGGVFVVRTLLSVILLSMLLVVPLGPRPPEFRLLLLAFGIGYFAFTMNGSLAVLLQANATVDRLAFTNVLSKVVWGLGMAAGIVLQAPLIGFAIVFTLTETLKLVLLQRVAREAVGLRLRVDPRATLTALGASLGFYALYLTQVLGWRLEVTLLGLLADHVDVGWYGASQTLASITLLLTPVLAGVLTPLFSRSHQRSLEEMIGVLRLALETLIGIATPLALLLALGAPTWITLAFGREYGPAAGSLRMLAPLFVLIYISILLSAALVVQGRGWRLSFISACGLLSHTLFGLILVPVVGRSLGSGGAGTGMALASVLKEGVVMALMLISLGAPVLDQRRLSILARTVLAVLGTVAVHIALVSLGPWRLVADSVVYPLLAIRLGAVDLVAFRKMGGALGPLRR